MPAILAKKLGMTQRFLDDGHALDPTVLAEDLRHPELASQQASH